MLLAFIVAAIAQVTIFIQYPVFGAVQPLVLLVGALSYQLRWLTAAETLMFAAISGYLVDVFASIQAGTVLVSTIFAMAVFIAVERQFELPSWLSILLAVVAYEGLLWMLSGGWFGWILLAVLLIGPSITLIMYGLLYFGVRKLELRL